MNTALDEFVKQEARAKAKEMLMALVLDGKIAIADAAEELHIPEPELLQEFAPIIASELDARTRKGKTLGNQRTSKACNGTNVPKTVLDEYVDEQIAERQGKHVERLALDFILKGKISLADAAESLELPKAELLREFAALLTASNTGDAKGRISQKEQDMAKGNQSTPQSPEEMIQNQWILDNIMVPLFFDSKSAEAGDALQEILRTLLHDPKLVVVEHHPEDTMSNMGFHGIRIDVKARDGYGRQLALELQKESDEEIYPRAVFEGATMTVHSLNYGEPYDNIDKVVVIFIADKDPEGEGEPLYRYDAMMDAKQGKLTPIAPTYIFVNGQYRNPATELGRMIADIMEADPSKMNTPILRKRMNMLKNTKAGRNSMRTALDEYIDQQVDQQVTEREENRLKQALFGLVMKGKITMTDAAETLEATETELWREFAAFVTATAT